MSYNDPLPVPAKSESSPLLASAMLSSPSVENDPQLTKNDGVTYAIRTNTASSSAPGLSPAYQSGPNGVGVSSSATYARRPSTASSSASGPYSAYQNGPNGMMASATHTGPNGVGVSSVLSADPLPVNDGSSIRTVTTSRPDPDMAIIRVMPNGERVVDLPPKALKVLDTPNDGKLSRWITTMPSAASLSSYERDNLSFYNLFIMSNLIVMSLTRVPDDVDVFIDDETFLDNSNKGVLIEQTIEYNMRGLSNEQRTKFRDFLSSQLRPLQTEIDWCIRSVPPEYSKYVATGEFGLIDHSVPENVLQKRKKVDDYKFFIKQAQHIINVCNITIGGQRVISHYLLNIGGEKHMFEISKVSDRTVKKLSDIHLESYEMRFLTTVPRLNFMIDPRNGEILPNNYDFFKESQFELNVILRNMESIDWGIMNLFSRRTLSPAEQDLKKKRDFYTEKLTRLNDIIRELDKIKNRSTGGKRHKRTKRVRKGLRRTRVNATERFRR